MQKSVPLAVITRSGLKDTLHRGSVAVTDDTGDLIHSAGDPCYSAYIRSAAKPIQCLPVILTGAAGDYGLDDADIAIICGSHRGGDDQVRRVKRILDKIGAEPGMVKSGRGLEDNCSGKHAGMLAVCLHQGYDPDTYLEMEHPHQRNIVEYVGRICNVDKNEIALGVDGCSAPIHYLTLRQMALGYARMGGAGRHFEPSLAKAIRRVFNAMWLHAGGDTGEPRFNELLGEKPLFMVKRGGAGVYCGSVPDHGLGIAVKIDDGSLLPVIPVYFSVMKRLGIISESTAEEIAARFYPPVNNRAGIEIGTIETLV